MSVDAYLLSPSEASTVLRALDAYRALLEMERRIAIIMDEEYAETATLLADVASAASEFRRDKPKLDWSMAHLTVP